MIIHATVATNGAAVRALTTASVRAIHASHGINFVVTLETCTQLHVQIDTTKALRLGTMAPEVTQVCYGAMEEPYNWNKIWGHYSV